MLCVHMLEAPPVHITRTAGSRLSLEKWLDGKVYVNVCIDNSVPSVDYKLR